ncbi:hypothetical protein AAES_00399 [Amazona aestiva]|uniref:F110D protein n=1 Tax=Amazona aestiva TaxID=12930 RepID=A0A0Q3X7G8_AMAAE|nr:hypothetical protein AAES_00399 [Amazona aestiva]
MVPGRGSPLARLNRGPVCPQGPGAGGGRPCSAVERLEADKAKYVKSLQVINRRQEPALRPRSPWLSPGAQRALSRQQRHELCRSPGQRRAGGSHVLRPESIIHRQKRDCPDGDKENTEGSALPRPLCPGPRRDNCPSSSPARGLDEGPPAPQSPEPPVPWVPTEEEEEEARTPGASSGGGSGGIVPLPGGSVAQPPGKPALALRVSLPLSEQERFFNCCGLDRALVAAIVT